MSYVLDGIETAFTVVDKRGHDYGDGLPVDSWREWFCPCGPDRIATDSEYSDEMHDEGIDRAHAALRFHYTHCEQAKVRKLAGPPVDSLDIREKVKHMP